MTAVITSELLEVRRVGIPVETLLNRLPLAPMRLLRLLALVLAGYVLFGLPAAATQARASKVTVPSGPGLDAQFGKNGAVRLPRLSPSLTTVVTACVSSHDGGVFARATALSRKGSRFIARKDFVVKYTRRGRLDRTFARRGIFSSLRYSRRAIFDAKEDAAGHLYLLVERRDKRLRGQFEIMRLTKRGQIDRRFGSHSNGVVPLGRRSKGTGLFFLLPLTNGGLFVVSNFRDEDTDLIVFGHSGSQRPQVF